jgi:hypothetical protein
MYNTMMYISTVFDNILFRRYILINYKDKVFGFPLQK